MDLVGILEQSLSNPLVFFILLFIYSYLAAVILPIPIEIALLWPLHRNLGLAFYTAASIILSAGKTVGAWSVFLIGLRVEDNIRHWSEKFRIVDRVVNACIKFVARTGYIGLFLILAVPGMADTIPIYVYSLFNKEGKLMHMGSYVLANFCGAIVRSFILFILYEVVGIAFFG